MGRKPLYPLEHSLQKAGFSHVAGVDEAGRGCLAGPVFAAAVIFPPKTILPEVDDSKKLSPQKRERLFDEIVRVALAWNVAAIDPTEIDQINIHRASLKAMGLAVQGLRPWPDYLLIDGRFPLKLEVPQSAIIRGDAQCQVVAAASILAKVSRDRWMREVARQFPGYGFERHKGYGTVTHRVAIQKYGLTPIHRRSFRSSWF